jgi:hypothetical protein
MLSFVDKTSTAKVGQYTSTSISFLISALSEKCLDQTEKICTLSVHMFTCLCSTVQQSGASLASVSSINHNLKTDRQTEETRYRYNFKGETVKRSDTDQTQDEWNIIQKVYRINSSIH